MVTLFHVLEQHSHRLALVGGHVEPTLEIISTDRLDRCLAGLQAAQVVQDLMPGPISGERSVGHVGEELFAHDDFSVLYTTSILNVAPNGVDPLFRRRNRPNSPNG